MKQFIRAILASVVGTLIALFFLVFLTFSVVGLMAAFSSSDMEDQLTGIQDNSILRLSLDGVLQDHFTKRDLFESLIFQDEPHVMGLYEIGRVLKEAAQDKRIRGVLLDFKSFQSGLANAESLRREILNFKASKKFVIAYGEVLSEVDYIVASAADEVILYPKGFFEWNGVFSKLMFFKNTMKKLNVVPQVFKVGQYKSAVEPFINEKMSDASREQSEVLIAAIWDQMMSHAVEKTKLEKMDLDKMAEGMNVMFAEDALEKGFVNSLASLEEVENKLKELSEAKEKPHYVSWRHYLNEINEHKSETSENTVALVFASGQILSDSYDDEAISSTKLRALLDKIRRDKKVKAVVLRVNSPGGSALASDVIWTGTQWLKDAKPVVASFGNVAASGGYYMSAGSQYIFAEPSTVTGSIGVFGLTFASEKFWNNKVGSTFDTVKSHRYSDIEAMERVYSIDERQKIQKSVDKIYQDFLKVVTLGRNQFQTPEQVHQVAQGRVWIGRDALSNGLVDGLGGMNEAIAKAVELAKLEDYKVEVFPKELSPLQQFFKGFGQVSQSLVKAVVPEFLQTYLPKADQPSLWRDQIYTRLPYDFEVR